MRNDVMHELIGYDLFTNRVVYRATIPAQCESRVISMVGPESDDPDAIDSYVVDTHLANEIVGVARLPAAPQEAEYFLESLATV